MPSQKRRAQSPSPNPQPANSDSSREPPPMPDSPPLHTRFRGTVSHRVPPLEVLQVMGHFNLEDDQQRARWQAIPTRQVIQALGVIDSRDDSEYLDSLCSYDSDLFVAQSAWQTLIQNPQAKYVAMVTQTRVNLDYWVVVTFQYATRDTRPMIMGQVITQITRHEHIVDDDSTDGVHSFTPADTLARTRVFHSDDRQPLHPTTSLYHPILDRLDRLEATLAELQSDIRAIRSALAPSLWRLWRHRHRSQLKSSVYSFTFTLRTTHDLSVGR
ncbi:hypothetical protein K2173_001477 [Erythroxylum novogranatense]|uniref:Uncharacterized protein n=1 Tax=Erythroxylum novogranatense TaxID=1862640 RepID=A0AAV8U808_9ROSI|nr:hypothetical protein K2173_001477 [Erythroxylum novogranatense]